LTGGVFSARGHAGHNVRLVSEEEAHVKTTREQMEIIDAYETVGSYRGAAALCGQRPRR